MLQDLDGQLLWHYPADPQLIAGIHRVLDVLSETGFDLLVGRKLFHFALRAGLRQVQVRVEPYHLVAGAPSTEDLGLWELKLDIAFPAIVTALGSVEAAESLRNRFLEHLRNPETLTYSVVFTVTGVKP